MFFRLPLYSLMFVCGFVVQALFILYSLSNFVLTYLSLQPTGAFSHCSVSSDALETLTSVTACRRLVTKTTTGLGKSSTIFNIT